MDPVLHSDISLRVAPASSSRRDSITRKKTNKQKNELTGKKKKDTSSKINPNFVRSFFFFPVCPSERETGERRKGGEVKKNRKRMDLSKRRKRKRSSIKRTNGATRNVRGRPGASDAARRKTAKEKKQKSDDAFRRMKEVIACMPANIEVIPVGTSVPDPRTRWTVSDAVGMSRCRDALLVPGDGEGAGFERDILDQVERAARLEHEAWDCKETRLHIDVTAIINSQMIRQDDPIKAKSMKAINERIIELRGHREIFRCEHDPQFLANLKAMPESTRRAWSDQMFGNPDISLGDIERHLDNTMIHSTRLPIDSYECQIDGEALTRYFDYLGFVCPLPIPILEDFVYDTFDIVRQGLARRHPDPATLDRLLDIFQPFQRAILAHYSCGLRDGTNLIKVYGIPLASLQSIFGGPISEVVEVAVNGVRTMIGLPETLLFPRSTQVASCVETRVRHGNPNPAEKKKEEEEQKERNKANAQKIIHNRMYCDGGDSMAPIVLEAVASSRPSSCESVWRCQNCYGNVAEHEKETRILPIYLLPFFLSKLPEPYLTLNGDVGEITKKLLNDLGRVAHSNLAVSDRPIDTIQPDRGLMGAMFKLTDMGDTSYRRMISRTIKGFAESQSAVVQACRRFEKLNDNFLVMFERRDEEMRAMRKELEELWQFKENAQQHARHFAIPPGKMAIPPTTTKGKDRGKMRIRTRIKRFARPGSRRKYLRKVVPTDHPDYDPRHPFVLPKSPVAAVDPIAMAAETQNRRNARQQQMKRDFAARQGQLQHAREIMREGPNVAEATQRADRPPLTQRDLASMPGDIRDLLYHDSAITRESRK